ncbi:hypothetical protein A3A76_01235 [Candidatus Woesebacteria bacterium RIFCSPLOWO2_01_FULL_39_23]|uniref:Sortase n=1 Tax=Candidatus Woesebacteria bacterium RIFCSPHIGHO2_01_FULL_40_22 TaxID=1802499 RepID=A0A1F7YH05_9BACT|nr:MAG: hypothetical protein A2141_05135 [Candidatus Woesebacteria bacterium RBG_16_40_11]OGM26450.1 MAG: hypothetical protein A2628_02830 [Candidatus Woesebacteria bacterium RIFCSPHIGHO2_01_FULL_40_22]OGM37619.1 MAG: hypothetical protein A3E41_05345 [Candidatus Woesebacteria bacterium RIFCSPHIGHO2_12_FULL_38_9]OGM62903.1 MAG: hypothetical protein A3A76_01235 [Candidatus Woesebacteria bacterium RIFCSPLOWO2_01_FULL_39_23]
MSKTVKRILAAINFISGSTILFATVFPIISYELTAPPTLISPLVDDDSFNSKAATTKASSWFEGGAREEDFTSTEVKYYTMSIPKLGVESATVTIGGEDLAKSLIHYPGTAVPGKTGNSVIFGHSALPLFFSPTNYKTIFSTLPKFQEGDEIIVNYDGITYKYVVETKFEVLPKDIQVLEQNSDGSYISLITCVPPGDPRKPRRLVVRARLAPYN